MDNQPVTPYLPPIVENQVLQFDAGNLEDEDDDDTEVLSHSSVDEKTSLVHSGSLSFSYTQSTSKYQSTHEQEAHIFDVSSTRPDYTTIIQHASVITDFQASLFLPSLMISSYSSMRKSYDQIARSTAQSMTKRSIYTSKSLPLSIIERFSDDQGASYALTLFNILPALLGSALFSIPYAISAGGYLTIPCFLLIAFLSSLTCKLLADSMYEVSPKSKRLKRTRLDYVEIAEAAFGRHGSRLMNFTLIFYLFSVSIVNIVLIGKACYTILDNFTNLSLKALMAIFSILVIPTVFIQKLSCLAYLSFASTLAILIGGVASIIIFIVQSSSSKGGIATIPIFDWEGFALALGIWSYSVIPHSIIPQVETCMKKPQKIARAINLSFIISTSVKILFGVMGAITYGRLTDAIVANNIKEYSYGVSVLINGVIFCFAVLNFPLNFFVVCDAFDSITLGMNHIALRKGGIYHPLWISLTRPVLVGIALGIALVIPYFELLVGVLGSLLGTLLAFIFPCILHLKLKWKNLSRANKLLDFLILFLGCTTGLIGLFASSKGLFLAVSRT